MGWPWEGSALCVLSGSQAVQCMESARQQGVGTC
jgi:hypothetical protein